MFVCRTVSEIFSVKKRRDLETEAKGSSRSLKMAPFNNHTTFYWSAIVRIVVCCIIFKLFDVESS